MPKTLPWVLHKRLGANGAKVDIDKAIETLFKPCAPAAIAAVVAWLAENEPPEAWGPKDVLHAPAIARDLDLLQSPSLLDT